MDIRQLSAGALHLPSVDLASGRLEPDRVEVGRIAGPHGDHVTISPEARELLDGEQHDGDEGRDARAHDDDGPAGIEPPLEDDAREQVRELEARDREVRTHEQAHQAAAGGLAAGGPSYSYQTGPDGQRYATGGEVQIRLGEGRTPEETVRLMERARAAALAPAQPSAQDFAVAAEAAQIAAAARREQTGDSGDDNGDARLSGVDLLA